ncbi:MAG: carboxypeptidase-like regulatory domain-containing protein [Deltaproteobacteria bacterium]|nr:carboxypeptidase-like regulatory domain-containing protein [Deltaproteobacteria bacterium]
MKRIFERHFTPLARRYGLFLVAIFVAGAVTLPARGTAPQLRGRILDVDGEALSKIQVELVEVLGSYQRADMEWEGQATPAPVATARTGSSGRFEVQTPEAGVWALLVRAPDSPSLVLRPKAVLETQDLKTVQLVESKLCHGKVVDSKNRPVPTAWITLSDHRRWGIDRGSGFAVMSQWAQSDESGQFSLHKPPTGDISVTAWSPAHLETKVENYRCGSNIRLRDGTSRTLEILETNGQPASEVLVRIGRERWPVARTDELGRLTLVAASDVTSKLRLITADGRNAAVELLPSFEEPRKVASFTLPTAERFSGRVVDSLEQRSVPGALVWRPRDPSKVVTTSKDGSFSLTGGPFPRKDGLYLAALGFLPSYSPSEGGQARSGLELPLTPSTRLFGRVLDSQGEPVPRAEIVAIQQPSARRSDTTHRGNHVAVTDEAGSFQLSNLSPEQLYGLRTTASGFAPDHKEVFTVKVGAKPTPTSIVLEKGIRAFGLILDSEDNPVPGALIQLKSKPKTANNRLRWLQRRRGEGTPEEGASDDKGTFEFFHLIHGTYNLLVTAEGFAPNLVRGIELPRGDQEVDLGTVYLEAGTALEGQVTDSAGLPLEGASVHAETASADQFGPFTSAAAVEASKVLSAADGFFALEDLQAGTKVLLKLRKEGYLPRELPGVEVPPLDPLVVVLEPASTVSGRVENQSGEPVTGARLVLQDSASGIVYGNRVSPRFDRLAMSHSGEEGRFVLENVKPGQYSLSGSGTGYRTAKIPTIEVAEGATVEGIVLILEKGAVIQGRILAPDGKPVSQASLRLSKQSHRQDILGGAKSAVSDSQGHYRLEGLESGFEQTLDAFHEVYGQVRKTILVEPGEQRVDIIFEPGFSISGQVTDQQGDGIANAQLQLESNNHLFGGKTTRSGADGSYRFESVQAGRYEIEASHEDYAQSRTEMPIEMAGSPVEGIEIRLSRGAAIYGRVLGLDFDELARVELSAFQQNRRQTFPGSNHPDFEGKYRLENLSPGTWTVIARLDQGQAVTGTVTLDPGVAEVPLDLEFEDGLTLRGHVLVNEAPLDGAQVFVLQGPGGHFSATTTDYQGRFELSGLKEGSYQLRVTAASQSLQHSETVQVSTDQELLIELSASNVSGQVIDALTFEPLGGALVKLQPESTGLFSRFGPSAAVTTSPEGLFRLDSITAGAWRLQVSREGYANHDQAFEIQGNSDVEGVEVRLSPAEGLTLDVFLPGGRPAREVSVALLGPGDSVVSSGSYPAREGGRVSISTAQPGTFQMLVSAQGQATVRLPVTIPSPLVNVQLRLATNLAISVPELAEGSTTAVVTVLGSDQVPHRGLSLDGTVLSEWFLFAGAGQVFGLPSGTWTITASLPDGRTWSGVTHLSGQRDHQVVLE